jgi:xanthine/uracil permease
MLARIGELLTTRPAIWLAGFAVGMTTLVLMSLLGTAGALLAAVPLLLVSAAVIILKDRVLILRRRILLTRQRTSRRQFFATLLSVVITAGLTATLGWLLRAFIFGSYEDQVRRHMTPKKKPK